MYLRSGNIDPMELFILLMLIAAAVFFTLAALGVSSRVNLVAAGLLAWLLTELVPHLDRML